MTIKQDRVADRIRTILSELLLREIADPRLQGITVTEVKIGVPAASLVCGACLAQTPA